MWKPVCRADEVVPDQITQCPLPDGGRAIAVRDSAGAIRVFQGTCPHQRRSLADGDLCDDVLTCAAHMWAFDIRSGEGIQGAEADLAEYPTTIEDGQVLVDPSAVEPTALWR